MTAHPLPRKVLTTDWNVANGKNSDWDGAGAVAIVFRKSLAEICSPSTGTAASPTQLNVAAGTDAISRPANGQLLRVLIVEDSEEDCELICFRLKKCGYTPRVERVFCEKTMRAALERKTWDIVFIDHGLPGFSGAEAMALLRKMGLQIPVLCITGTVDPVVIRQILAMGVCACLSKDDLSLLCRSVKRALGGSSPA